MLTSDEVSIFFVYRGLFSLLRKELIICMIISNKTHLVVYMY